MALLGAFSAITDVKKYSLNVLSKNDIRVTSGLQN